MWNSVVSFPDHYLFIYRCYIRDRPISKCFTVIRYTASFFERKRCFYPDMSTSYSELGMGEVGRVVVALGCEWVGGVLEVVGMVGVWCVLGGMVWGGVRRGNL